MKIGKLVIVMCTLLFGLAACKSAKEMVAPTDATVEGNVIDSETNRGIANVLVRTNQFTETATTDSSGKYSLTIAVGDSFAGQVNIEASKFGYINGEISVSVSSGRKTMAPAIRMNRTRDSSSTVSGVGAAIVYIGSDVPSITVRESGERQSARLLYEVRDIRGVPVDFNNRVTVHFQIEGAIGGGEYLGADSVTTDANGRAEVALISGIRPGTVQVMAFLNDSIIARPVRMTIVSAPPDSLHATVGLSYLNFGALGTMGAVDTVYVLLGDRYSNPVPQGTNVYFYSDHGVIQGQAITNAFGAAKVILMSGNPYPIATRGESYVHGQSVDWTGRRFTLSARILWTGGVGYLSVSPSSFTIPDRGSQVFTYHVGDVFDNPMSLGTSIQITTTAGILSGETEVIFPDTQSPAWRDFSFALTDDSPQDTLAATSATVTIRVEHGRFGAATITTSGTID